MISTIKVQKLWLLVKRIKRQSITIPRCYGVSFLFSFKCKCNGQLIIQPISFFFHLSVLSMSKNFPTLRCAGLYFYIIILVSLCTVEILANPIATMMVQKRQATITITSTVYSTNSVPVIKVKATGNPSSVTYKPSKPKNCVGPVKFSEVEVSSSNNSIIFIAKGKSSVDINNVTSNLYGFVFSCNLWFFI